MIRINLLGKAPPKIQHKPARLEARPQALLLAGCFVIAAVYLCSAYLRMGDELRRTQDEVRQLEADVARLALVKKEVASYEQQKAAIDRQIAVIQELQKNRTGAQELLQVVASTVNLTETLWLTSFARAGSSFTIEGQAGSISAVARLIAELKRSGYFERVEIKETHQNPGAKDVTIFTFTLTAERSGAGGQPAASAAPGKS